MIAINLKPGETAVVLHEDGGHSVWVAVGGAARMPDDPIKETDYLAALVEVFLDSPEMRVQAAKILASRGV